MKSKKAFARIFLVIYMSILIVGAFHYHHFNLFPESCFSEIRTEKANSDLQFETYSVCSLQQFYNSITDFYYSSADIIGPLDDTGILFIPVTNNKNFKIRSTLLSRAPPTII